MHDTSFEKMERFVEVYLTPFADTPLHILDVGSQLVDTTQRTYRSLFDRAAWHYAGLDVEAGDNVDIAVASPYDWSEVPADTYDVVVSGQALEHIEYFWATAFEIGRVMRPGGITALIAPSNGFEHRFPVDCWRFYRDGFHALATYIEFEVVDAFTDWGREAWQDSILVMRKPQWDDAGRRRFHERAGLQRALLGRPAPSVAGPVPAPSPLAAVQPGLLSPVLEDIRIRWHHERAAAAAPPRPRWKTIATRVLGRRGTALLRRLRQPG